VTENHRRLRAGKKIETLVETFSERRRTKSPDARRREFDRKWKPIEVADDLDNVIHIVRSEREPWAGCDSAFDEEARSRSLRCYRRSGTLIWNDKRPERATLVRQEVRVLRG